MFVEIGNGIIDFIKIIQLYFFIYNKIEDYINHLNISNAIKI